MEEDIKNYMQDNINKGFHKFIYNDLGYDEKCIDIINAISNLIEENKELKHITQNYNAYQQKSDNPNSTIIIADEKWFINGYFKENFIPKSKVKEKIEEIEKLKDVPHELDFKAYYRVKDLRNIEIGILQQLLEENTGNHIPIID